jgi:uncharacterized membrane-anchored protein YitT (DUF2179 family)
LTKKSPQSKPIDWEHILAPKTLAYMISGALFVTMSMKGFMIPNNFLDGGVTGISILLRVWFGLDISIFLLLINLPFIYLGYIRIGKTFAVQTILVIVLLAILMKVMNFPIITQDKLLIAVFGGFFVGLGIGLVIRAGAVIDGLEVLAEYTTKKSAFTSGEIILMINTGLILAVAIQFGIETALYTILTFFTAMRTSDYVVDGFEEFTSLNIVSSKHEQVKDIIVNRFNKAITVYKGERGYLPESFNVHQECDIVTTIVTRLEVFRLKQAISELDPNAFFFIQSIKEVKGGITKKRGGIER